MEQLCSFVTLSRTIKKVIEMAAKLYTVFESTQNVAGILTDKHVFGSSVHKPFWGGKNNKIRIANIRFNHNSIIEKSVI